MRNPTARPADRHIRKFSNSLCGLLCCRRIMGLFTVWLFVWGTAVLMLRAVWGGPHGWLVWGGIGFIPAAAAGLWTEYRRRPGRAEVLALLDRYNHLGGLLMASDETAAETWLKNTGAVALPRLSWQAKKETAAFLIAALFCGAGFWMPHYFHPQPPSKPFHMEEPIQEIREQLEVLEETEVVPEEKAEALKKTLEKLAESVRADDPARAWETLDHLEETLQAEAEAGAGEMASAMDAMLRMESLAAVLDHLQDLKPETREALKNELARMSSEDRSMSQAIEQMMGEEFMQALQSGKLTSRQLQQLRSALEKERQRMTENLRRLADAGMGGDEAGELSAEPGGVNPSELAEFLSRKENQLTPMEALSAMPGQGGIERGRGDAVITWKAPTEEIGFRYREETIPLSELKSMKDHLMIGTGRTAPETGGKPVPAASGALSEQAGAAGSAITPRILPRHRGPVQRYFDRTDPEGAEEIPMMDAVWSGWG